jgi:hypothetical protein
MIAERMSAVRDDLGSTTAIGAVIGMTCGALTGLVAFMANAEPGDGFLGVLVTFQPGVLMLLVIALALGMCFGGAIGYVEAAIAFAYAHRAAHRFTTLAFFGGVLAVAFFLFNTLVTAVAVGLAFGLDKTDALSPVVSGVTTLFAVLVYVRLQSTDWPVAHPRPHARVSYGTGAELPSAQRTMVHNRLAERVRDYDTEQDRRSRVQEN